MATLLLAFSTVQALVAPPARSATAPRATHLASTVQNPYEAVAREPPSAEAGLHGSQSCFLPVDQMDSSVMWPRILRIAGMYPGVQSGDVAAVPATPPAPAIGEWLYDFPDAHGSEFGVVAVPGSDILHAAEDPVAMIADSASLGLLIEPQECLVVIDRAETDYDDRQFFAYADANAVVHVRRLDGGSAYSPPAGWAALGRVILVKLKYDPKTMAKKGTWMEEDD
mmetsp:Transcript_16487/g.49655  ORF Transcript_16487/g.49655 Transcript_16487/m.49655 type:complete len:225 (+) Transcript_16487:132-806(+)